MDSADCSEQRGGWLWYALGLHPHRQFPQGTPARCPRLPGRALGHKLQIVMAAWFGKYGWLGGEAHNNSNNQAHCKSGSWGKWSSSALSARKRSSAQARTNSGWPMGEPRMTTPGFIATPNVVAQLRYARRGGSGRRGYHSSFSEVGRYAAVAWGHDVQIIQKRDKAVTGMEPSRGFTESIVLAQSVEGGG